MLTMDQFLNLSLLHVRVTTDKTLDEVVSLICLDPLKYIVSQEGFKESHLHYHALIQTQDVEAIRRSLKSAGITGNKCYSISTVRNERQLSKYILKEDGPYKYKGFTQEQIDLFKKCSTLKGKKGFADALTPLEDSYIAGSLDLDTFIYKFLELKVSYGQNIYPSHIQAYFMKMRMRKDPSYIRAVTQTLSYRLNEYT